MEIVQTDITSQIGDIIADALKNGDSVALPGFGTFGIRKDDEHIENINGQTYLCPPKITAVFTPAIKFTKALKEKQISYE